MTKIATTTAVAALLALSAFQATAHDRYDRRFELVNNTDRLIYSVYAPHIDDRRPLTPDLLGDAVVRPGESMVIEPNRRLVGGYCRFNIRVVYDHANGPTQTIRDVNLCEETQVVARGQRRNGYVLATW